MDPGAAAYGEGVELADLQSQAPMAGAAGAAPGGAPGMAGPPPLGLDAPSQIDLPVTSGAAAGPGDGPEALGLPQDPNEESKADVRSLDPAMVQALLAAASRPDATPSFKRRVREITTYL